MAVVGYRIAHREQFAQPQTAEAGFRFAVRSQLSSGAIAHWEQFAQLQTAATDLGLLFAPSRLSSGLNFQFCSVLDGSARWPFQFTYLCSHGGVLP